MGYLKYIGKDVQDGIMDARKSAEALMGLDEMLRFALAEEYAVFRGADFEIPVQIRKGSWEVVIPEIIDKLLSPQGVGTAYGLALASKAATEGLFETGASKDIKVIFRGGLKTLQWIAKIGSHLGTLTKKKFENAKVKQSIFGETIIEIPNEKGEILSVPKKYFDIYTKCPVNLFSKNANLISRERTLEIGVFEKGKEEKVIITEKEKEIFYSGVEEENNSEEILFPELVHGQKVELPGEITRATESTNTIGFQYNGHVLTCKPENGNIAAFKRKIISQIENHFFPAVKMIGTVRRTDENHFFDAPRPQIIFTDIVPMEKIENNRSLFEK